MAIRSNFRAPLASAILLTAVTGTAFGQALFQPPGANLTYGDVTHGTRAQSASTNPAAAAADVARQGEDARSGAILSVAAGVEYGNIQEIWDFYDEISQAFSKSDPDDGLPPGQNPGDKPDDGIDLGDIWDTLDPDIQDELDAIATEVARQAGILALIATEGYGKAWIAADAPVIFSTPKWGGAWTMQAQWSGTARAFGIVEAIQFDRDTARDAIQDWFDTEISQRPTQLDVGGQVRLVVNAVGAVSFALQNDSLIAYKSAQATSISTGYSRAAWSNDAGTLYLGGEAKLHDLRLSRLGVRFGDITDSEELFDDIRNADFERDTRLGLDLGMLWVAENYQLGAQVTNVNQPTFDFPEINTAPFENPDIIRALQRDSTYEMESQLKLEASYFSENRRWSWHTGLDANAAADPVGDEFQWFTASGGYTFENNWLQNVRFGYRSNLAGTEKDYASLGATFLKYVNLDLASALSTTTIDDTTLPEGLMISLGVQFGW